MSVERASLAFRLCYQRPILRSIYFNAGWLCKIYSTRYWAMLNQTFHTLLFSLYTPFLFIFKFTNKENSLQSFFFHSVFLFFVQISQHSCAWEPFIVFFSLCRSTTFMSRSTRRGRLISFVLLWFLPDRYSSLLQLT